MSAYDHVIVGGGVAGMTTAILLRKAGHSVALVEAFPLLAPTIRGFRRRGVQFDTGLHYVGGLGDGDPLDVYFRHLGLNEHIEKVPYRPDGFDSFRSEAERECFQMPCGFEAMKGYLGQRFPDEIDAIRAYEDTLLDTINTSPFLNFSREFNLDAAFHTESATVQDYLDALTDNETLKAILSYPCILYGVPPTKAMMSTHALVAGSYILSAHTVRGGGLTLAKSYETRLEQLGVDILCKRRVESIRIGDERNVRGVTLNNGHELETSSCIWTGHPRSLLDVTPDTAFRPAFRKRLNALQDTASALVLFGISDTPITALDGKNIVSWPGTPFEHGMSGKAPLQESILFLSAAQDTESGKTAVTAIMPASFDEYEQWASSQKTPRSRDYEQHKSDVLAQMTTEVFRRVPELQGHVTFIDGATPLTFRDYCETPTGSLYGLCHAHDQFNPAPITKAKGLTLAGQSIVAPGILGATVSAYVTSGILLGHEALHNELRELV